MKTYDLYISRPLLRGCAMRWEKTGPFGLEHWYQLSEWHYPALTYAGTGTRREILDWASSEYLSLIHI